jgi:uncharacterized protein YycO
VRAGQFGLSIIGGGLGRAIWLGQAIIGDRSRWTHAFLVLDEKSVVEAMPDGARIAPLKPYLELEKRSLAAFSRLTLTDEQRATVVQVGREFEGVPYSFLDYVSLSLEHLHVRPPWVQHRVESSGRMICSQLVDRAYDIAGVHLFDDGRKPGDVTPGDLSRCLLGHIPV